jgi:spoIIIJ-associated protein
MDSLEITAKSVDEAKKTAAERLGVSADRVIVTVLEETKGLFGKSSVRVRAEVAPEAEAVAAPAKSAAKPARGAKASAKESKAPAPAPVATAAVAVAEPPVDAKPKRGAKKTVEKPAEPEGDGDEGEKGGEEIVATAADADQLSALLKELLEAAGLQVNVRIREVAGRYVTLGLDGKDAAFLVGKHGEVLNAMQYLVNIIGGRRFDNGIRAMLDANDYRRRREETLTALAVRIAEQVKERGEEAVLDALPAFERRIVHKALGEISGISTYSEGEEPNRRVVIAPAD